MANPAITEKPANADDDLPVAQATAMVVADSNSASTCTMIDLPTQSAGFQLTGYPIRLGDALDKEVTLPAGLDSGWYVHSIQLLPDVEVTHLTNADKANQILKSNAHLGRRLGVGRDVPVLDQNDGFHYTHTLPVPADLEALQVKLNGFPPRVTIVEDKSPLAGKLHPRQVLVELRIPGKPTINAQTPGFTAHKVEGELKSSSSVAGIRLTVKDELKAVRKEKGSSAAFDDCVIM